MITKKMLWSTLLALALSACGSNVKLDNVPVEDRSASPLAGAAGAAGNAGAAGQSGVAQVDLAKSAQDSKGPAGASNLIYFDYDSYVIKPEFQSVVDAHAQFLKANKARKAMIEGNTDDRGGREYNLALGQRRAEAVRRALGLLGVADTQLEAVSFGKEKPAVPGTDEASLAKNRRAEIVYR